MSLVGFDRFYYMDNMFSTAVIVAHDGSSTCLSGGYHPKRLRICRIPGLFSASWNAVILCFERCWKKAKHTSLKSSMILLMLQKSCSTWSGFCLNLYQKLTTAQDFWTINRAVGLGNTPWVVGSQKMPGPKLKIDPCQSWISHQN